MAPSAAHRASEERWARDVSAIVRDELDRRARAMRAAGHDPSALGSPAEMAQRMLATLPEPSAWNALGPFYSARGVAQLLGGVTRQAVEDRRKRGAIIALQTAEGTWVYPMFQFGADNQPVRAIVQAHRRLAVGRTDAWSAAAILIGRQPELGGRSIAEHLRTGGDPGAVEELLAPTVAALA